MKLKSILLMSAASVVIGNAAEAQTHVTTAGKKFTLVEEATGAWCGYCPDGTQVIQQFIEPYGAKPNYPNAIVVSFHNSRTPDDDAMELAGDPYCSGTGYISGFPKGTVDRYPFVTNGGNVGLDRYAWVRYVDSQVNKSPNIDINMDCTFDPATRLLTVKVTGIVLVAGTGPYNVNAYVVEDSILSGTTGRYKQYNYMTTGDECYLVGNPSWFIGKGNPIVPTTYYAHMNVVEKIMCTGGSIWGETLFSGATTVGQKASKTWTYTVPANFIGTDAGAGWPINYKHLKVVGMVQKFGATTKDRAIENAVRADVKTMWANVLGVENTTTALSDVVIFPNPATNKINVQCKLNPSTQTNVTITNTIGQVVFNGSYTTPSGMFSEDISLKDFSNGVYFMNISNNGQEETKQFVVNK